MSEANQPKTEEEFKEWQKQHLDPGGRKIHNAMIDIQIHTFREAIALLEKRVAELEADKVDPEGK